MSTPKIPTPEAGDEIPSFSPGARESASKRRERKAAYIGDTLTPGDKKPSQKLANASCATAVTADLTEGPKGGTKPDGLVEDPMPRWIDQDLPRVAETCVRPPQEAFVPSILRRPENADLLRGAGVVKSPATPSPAPPAAASVTPAVTVAPAIGSICPTCLCRVPARRSAAERQRAYRARKRQHCKPIVP
jgi:hypothetical protein